MESSKNFFGEILTTLFCTFLTCYTLKELCQILLWCLDKIGKIKSCLSKEVVTAECVARVKIFFTVSPQSPLYPLTPLPTHPFIHSPLYPLTPLPTHPFIHSHPHTRSFTPSPTHWLKETNLAILIGYNKFS